jgi:hypothetical protein
MKIVSEAIVWHDRILLTHATGSYFQTNCLFDLSDTHLLGTL